LTLRLHFSVDLKSGNLSAPDLPGATIEKIGQDKQSDSIINGKRYRVVEQTYAVTPQESGSFMIDAPIFSGDIMTSSKQRSNFLSFAQTKPVSVRGNAISLTVKPTPASYPPQDPWLPSELLTLHQEWPENTGRFTVGEPITRTITLTAVGLTKAQLPEIIMPETPGIKVYPDQAQLNSNLTAIRLVSQKVQNFALVPSYAGEFMLPEISITWFNTVTNKTQFATLPAQKITVQAGAVSLTAQSAPKDRQSSESEVFNVNDNGNETMAQSSGEIVTHESRLTWLFLILWVLTTLAWLAHVRYLKRNGVPPLQPRSKPLTNANHYLALLAACKQNDASLTSSLILPWLNQLYGDNEHTISSLTQVESIVNNSTFVAALNDLQAYLYGGNQLETTLLWRGETLLASIQNVNKSKQRINNTPNKFTLNP